MSNVISKQKNPKGYFSGDSKGQNTDSLEPIIGIPPSSGSGLEFSQNLINNASLMIEISPCKPKFEMGMSLFNLESDWNTYKNFLEKHGFSPHADHNSKKAITVVIQADSLPSDNFTNEYGEHFLNKITDFAGSAFGELSQMTGSKNITEAGGKIAGSAKEAGFDTLAAGVQGGADILQKIGNYAGQNEMLKGMSKMADRLLAGARIDFPQVWKNSSYNSTFSFSVKLFNPKPGNKESTNKYIVGPLAALLCLALPQTSDDQKDTNSYNFPFFCQVDCPGLFKITAGAISNISVVKGGDQGSIAYNNRLGMVDVKIDFINLHSTMLLSAGGENLRPTLKGYLQNLNESTDLNDLYEKDEYLGNASLGSVWDNGRIGTLGTTRGDNVPEETLGRIRETVSQPQSIIDTTVAAAKRVYQEKIDMIVQLGDYIYPGSGNF